jgi:hypothetical protein
LPVAANSVLMVTVQTQHGAPQDFDGGLNAPGQPFASTMETHLTYQQAPLVSQLTIPFVMPAVPGLYSFYVKAGDPCGSSNTSGALRRVLVQ